MILAAHIRHSDHKIQTVQEHLEAVSRLARKYGDRVNLGAHAELAGFLHDMGKFTKNFTVYLENAVLRDEVAAEKIDHSTAGAKYLYDHFLQKDSLRNFVIETVGMAILSHHSGLQNFMQPDLSESDYIRRVKNKDLPNYDEVVRNFEAVPGNKEKVQALLEEATQEMTAFSELVKPLDQPMVYLSLMQKLVFSCLIDADRTDTRCFEEMSEPADSDFTEVFRLGYQHLMKNVRKWEMHAEGINILRNEMSEGCDEFAERSSGIYTLTVPTGGGKTVASLRYALKHSLKFNKSKIIYVVPFTTILEQNAEAVREFIDQPEVVLEHHANVVDDHKLDTEEDFYGSRQHKQLQLARDSWDHPIIFTTMVQFLDAFYQKGTRKGRRLHNLTNAVIVFDEVQSVPYQHRDLFHSAINFLSAVGNSSVILCTATQPVTNAKVNKMPLLKTEGREIISNLNRVVDAFKRVEIASRVETDGWNAGRIASFVEDLLEERNSALIILNTKSAVRKLYAELKDLSDVYVAHLSTSMCPAHRKRKLRDINDRLGKEKVVCVSTQLIEAGVDISFECVVRSLAGLDSIAQAAGRCNRNGERETGDVYIIKAKDEDLSKLPEIRIGAEVTNNYILSNPAFAGRLLHPEAIELYFMHFLNQARSEIMIAPKGLDAELFDLLRGEHQAKRKKRTLSSGMFKTIEKHFEAIHSPTTAVLVPFGEGQEIISRLNEEISNFEEFNRLMKKAQQYSVNLYSHELRKLSNEQLIQPLYDGSIHCLLDKAYDEEFGVSIEGKAKMESPIF